MEIVWFKRDLRVEDHAPLAGAVAASGGHVIPLYILEPDLWAQPDMARRHYDFLGECLGELDNSLAALGHPLVLRVGDAVAVLSDICAGTKSPVSARIRKPGTTGPLTVTGGCWHGRVPPASRLSRRSSSASTGGCRRGAVGPANGTG